jgi:hypothetical protein
MAGVPSVTEPAVVRHDGSSASPNDVAGGRSGLPTRGESNLAAARPLLEPGRRAISHGGRNYNPLNHFGALPISEVPVDLL